MILFLFLSHLALGIVLTLLFVSREAGVKFFRFNAGLAAVLLGAALASWPHDSPFRAFDLGSIAALAVSEAAVVFYWLTVGRMLAWMRRPLLLIGWVGGVVGIGAQSIVVGAGHGAGVIALTMASCLSSTLLLGGACTAMILGHWYLILPSMQVSHLQSIVKVHIASLVVRVAVVAAAVIVAIETWQPGTGPNFERYITSVSGIFFWQRVLFGLAGPALLSYLTWETAKIRSTQSATGILYVDFFTVVVGEVLAKYLLLATRVPL